MSDRPDLVIAVDPGREKCGIAVVHRRQGPICQKIIPTEELAATVRELAAGYAVGTVVIGDRTTSRQAAEKIRRITVNGMAPLVIPVNEHRSTDEARRRFWAENPPQGLRRLIPVTMQVPSRPVDDYVAVILAERFFRAPG